MDVFDRLDSEKYSDMPKLLYINGIKYVKIAYSPGVVGKIGMRYQDDKGDYCSLCQRNHPCLMCPVKRYYLKE